GISLCPEIIARTSTVRAALCGGVDVGAFHAAGDGLAQVNDGTQLLAMIALRGRTALRIAGPLRAHLEAGFLLPLTRPGITYRDLDRTTLRVEDSELFRVAPVGALAALGLGIEL